MPALQALSAAALRMFPAADHVDRAFQIAERHGGSLYDAIYISLARSMEAPVVTNDGQLSRVAKAARVKAMMIGAGLPAG